MLWKRKRKVGVVNDQIGSPTHTKDLAVLCVDMIQTNKYGKYHATNEEFCAWYEFACEIFKQANLKIKVNPVDSNVFLVKVIRPKKAECLKNS